jgi:hypothetical protein
MVPSRASADGRQSMSDATSPRSLTADLLVRLENQLVKVDAASWTQQFPDDPIGDWSDSWITLCTSPSPARLACDCAVSADSPSPVRYVDPELNYDPYRPKAPSMGELIHTWLEALDDGTWHIDATTGDFALLDPLEILAAKGPDIADLL